MSTPDVPLVSLNPGRDRSLKGGKCKICSLPLRVREAIDERMRNGTKVQEIIRWSKKTFPGENLEKIADDGFYQHRRRHVLNVERAARKLSDGQRMQHQKMRLAKAVLEDRIDPQAYFGPAAIAQDISKTAGRLDSAADQAYSDQQHAALAALSGALLRSHELRAKMGGSIREGTEVSLTVSLHELHQRLDPILGTTDSDRQLTARSLLGLPQNASTGFPVGNLAAQADPAAPRRRDSAADLTNPLGDPANPLTIDAEVTPESAESSPTSFSEPPGTKFR